MARYLVKIIGLSGKAMGRALVKTVRQEIEAFHEAARLRQALNNEMAATVGVDEKVKGMTLGEARLILNIKDLSDKNQIDTNYQHLFRANEKKTGGCFYLQSKIFRAKERIDKELAKQQAEAAAAAAEAAAEAEAQSQDKKPGPESQRD